MKTPHISTPRIIELADQIVSDIRNRKLSPGDPYLTAAETARMLRVSSTAANRALQLLSQRKVLQRRQRKGTFVLDLPETHTSSVLRRVHLLVHQNYLKTEGLMADGIIVGMQSALPGAEVHFNFLPPVDEVDYVNQLIGETMRSSDSEGFVLVRSSLAVQRLLHSSGLPVVVNGMLQPSVSGIAWIDKDYRNVGELLAEHLLRNGFQKIAILMRERMYPGDYRVLDAVRDTLEKAGCTAASLILRCLPPDREAIKAAAVQLLEETREPIGMLCRAEPWATGAAAAAEALNRKVGIVISDIYRKSFENPPPYPFTRSLLRPEEIGAHIGRMLAQQARGEASDPDHEIIPVKLELPE